MPAHRSPASSSRTDLLALSRTDAEAFVLRLGWPRYRAVQILRWLHQKRAKTVEEMTDLPKADRAELAETAWIGRAPDCRLLRSSDGTRKLLITLADGLLVESVLIPDDDRLTLCLSTQVGCTLDCGFCLTGRMGLKRNLAAHEIVEQVLIAQDHLEPRERISNLVLMGMGEPLANMDAVSEAVRRLTDEDWGLGIAARRITLSTAGMASRLREVAALGVNLAISLNATTNEQRARLMPAVNKLHPLSELLAACRAYPLPARRRLTFEYVLLGGVNDSEQDARRLPKLLNGIRCKLNLIPFNPFPGSAFRRPDEAQVLKFQAIVKRAGIETFIRQSRGRDVLGACGQLGETSPLIPAPDKVARALTVSESRC